MSTGLRTRSPDRLRAAAAAAAHRTSAREAMCLPGLRKQMCHRHLARRSDERHQPLPFGLQLAMDSTWRAPSGSAPRPSRMMIDHGSSGSGAGAGERALDDACRRCSTPRFGQCLARRFGGQRRRRSSTATTDGREFTRGSAARVAGAASPDRGHGRCARLPASCTSFAQIAPADAELAHAGRARAVAPRRYRPAISPPVTAGTNFSRGTSPIAVSSRRSVMALVRS